MRKHSIEPVGVNPGSAESHREFREEQGFPFELLVDEDMAVAKAYGAVKDDASGVARSVVVVGKDGKVIFSSLGAPAWPLVVNKIRDASDEQ